MRIGVNCFMLQPNVGGIKQYFFMLFQELLKQDEQNEYVFFYFPRNIDELAQLNTTRWQNQAILLNDQMEIRNHLDKIDIYFCPFGALWPRPLPIPTLITIVDVQDAFYPQFFTEFAKYNREYFYKGSSRMADRVLTISNFSKKTIARHHCISAKKVIVAHLSADERFYQAIKIAQKPDATLPEGDFIFYPANHWHHKNHDGLLRALQWLKKEKGLIIPVVFTGYENVPNSYPVRQKAIEYEVAQQVYFMGYVSVEELAYLYTKAKIMAFPSLFEGFGIPLIEAMAAGCPVIASSVTSLPEIGTDAVEYFDPNSPQSIAHTLETVWKSDALRQQLIVRGKQRAFDFSTEKLADIHQKAFQETATSFFKWRYFWQEMYQRYYHTRIHLKYKKALHAHQEGVSQE